MNTDSGMLSQFAGRDMAAASGTGRLGAHLDRAPRKSCCAGLHSHQPDWARHDEIQDGIGEKLRRSDGDATRSRSRCGWFVSVCAETQRWRKICRESLALVAARFLKMVLDFIPVTD